MPHASHRLDLLVVPSDVHQAVDDGALRELFERWGVDQLGLCPESESLIEGGCRRIWIDRPGRLWLYANQSGGFRAYCPVTSENVSAAFGEAHRKWKAGGDRVLVCCCGQQHALEDVTLRPPGAFASWALVFSSANGAQLTHQATRDLQTVLGEYRVVLRRP